ncbi:MAG: hypothetical protein M3N26_06810 [Pseudomonadota bacterium]|nr:hypothetical protein [Pseudomonadota bacterium]
MSGYCKACRHARFYSTHGRCTLYPPVAIGRVPIWAQPEVQVHDTCSKWEISEEERRKRGPDVTKVVKQEINYTVKHE